MGPKQPNYGYYGEQKRRPNFKVFGLIAGVLILLVVAIVVISGLLNKDSIGTQSQHLAARLTNLSALTTSASKQLSNGDLKKLNAEASIITDGVVSNLAGTLPKKVDKAVASDESDASDTTKLGNAALAGTYDTAYRQVLQQKLESITALLSEMSNKTNSKKLRTTISDDYKNYQAVLSNLTATP